MAKKKCLIVDSMHQSLFPLFQQTDWDIDYQPDITRDEIRKILTGYQGLIVRSKTTINADLLGDTPTIRFVARAGAGIDNIDQEFLATKHIRVIHAAVGNRDAVGEFAVGALLSLLRNIPKGDAQVRNLIWDREGNRGEEIMGKTVGIVGYGNMGRAFAKRLSGFGCKILAYDKYKTGYGDEHSIEVSMETLFEKADILSLHIPLTRETKNLVNADYINRFRKNFILINTARGEIVPLKDLANAVENGKIRGAALDVLENEKLHTLTAEQTQSFNFLKEQDNVIFTPHIAGWTFESHEKINVALVEQIKTLGL